MTKALLFDLDGTLLPMDTEDFVKQYFKAFSPKAAAHMEEEVFINALLKGTGAMIANVKPERTNQEVFEETFIALTKVDRETFWPVLDRFYEETFPTLSHLTQPTPLARKVVEEALDQGYRVAIATNPVFPRAAIEQRIKWAGVDHLPFEVVTVYEESNFTKPHRQYYEMICDRLKLAPEQCIMIGNDVQEDMGVSEFGMKNFLVHGHVIDRGNPQYTIHDQGTLEDLYNKMKNREGIFA